MTFMHHHITMGQIGVGIYGVLTILVSVILALIVLYRLAMRIFTSLFGKVIGRIVFFSLLFMFLLYAGTVIAQGYGWISS